MEKKENEEIIKRLIPINGYMDSITGLLYIQTPTSNFQDFLNMVREVEDENNFK